MAYTRRAMLRATAVGCGIAAVPLQGLATAGQAVCSFSGAGVYLYPCWGEARPYLVTKIAASTPTLAFHDPASQCLLWTQTLSLTGEFAGKLM